MIMMMMMMMMMMMIIIIIIIIIIITTIIITTTIALEGAVGDLLIAPRTVSNTYAQGAIVCKSRATCRVLRGTKGQLSI